MTFDRWLDHRAEDVEQAVARLLPAGHVYPDTIHESMRYSALGGGKRLRGILLMEAARLAGAPDTFDPVYSAAATTPDVSEAVIKSVGAVRAAAAAIEMVHAYSLVHDDLPCMDDDDMRRGKATNHRVFGEGIAVLAGDALLTRAFEVMGKLHWADLNPDTVVQIVTELATAAGTGGLIGGQVADLQSEGRKDEDATAKQLQELLTFIHSRKTGALFKASVRIGGFIAQADTPTIAALESYAEHFGLAFQIVDDLLDVEGDAEDLGKKVGSDERKGKLTFPVLYGVDAARSLAVDHIQRAKEALSPFPGQADTLNGLADFVLIRKS